MKSSNFNGAPRTLKESSFHEWGCAIERPTTQPVSMWKVSVWGVVVVLSLLALALTAAHP